MSSIVTLFLWCSIGCQGEGEASQALLRCDVGGCGPHAGGWIVLGSCGTYRNAGGTGIDITLSTGNPAACRCRNRDAEGPLSDVESDFLFADDESGSPGGDFILQLGQLAPGYRYKLVTFHSRPDEPPSHIPDVVVSGAKVRNEGVPIVQGHRCVEHPPSFVFTPQKASVTFRFLAPAKEEAGRGAQAFLNGFILEAGPPVVSFVSSWTAVPEDAGEVKIGIEARNLQPTAKVMVKCTRKGGTAEAGQDFRWEDRVLCFDRSRTKAYVSLRLCRDALGEGRETVVLELCEARGGVVGAPLVHTVAIRDPEAFYLPVDLGLPVWGGEEPVAGTVKEGFEPFVASRWADMYSHDAVWEDGSDGTGPPPVGPGLGGSRVHIALGTGNVGQGGLHVKGMCRGNLAGDEPPVGSPQGDPIANSWYYAVDWAGDPAGDILMRINGLAAGTYELLSFHNHWEPCTQSTRNCMECVCGMPPMPRIYAAALAAEPLPGYRGWNFGPGSGTGVTSLKEAYNVSPSHVLEDEKVATSRIVFKTDGADVLVVYEAGPNTYPDCARPGREGSRAILNAFVLQRLDPPQAHK